MKQLADLVSGFKRGERWIRTNKVFLSVTFALGLVAWIPLYGILFPPLVDLPEHLLISKLLWEKLSGVSHLDLEISWILGYRLFPVFMMVVFPACKLLGISFVFLPRIVAMSLMAIHVIIVAGFLLFPLKDKSWKSCVLAAGLALPAVVCMYSACWFIGFVNYTLAITVLVPAVFLTERFLGSGKLSDAVWLFVSLFLLYAAHPFALAFWVMWCFSRGLAGIALRMVWLEWKRLITSVLVLAPIVLYHVLATRNTALAPSSHSLLTQPPIVSVHDWYQNRFRPFFDGALLKPDDAADSRIFARIAIGLILFTAVLVFRATQDSLLRKAMLAGVFLLFGASWINEKFIPVPAANWLAYDYRFSSTVYALALALAGMVLIRLLPDSTERWRYKMLFVVLAVFSVSASAVHLKQVRQAYKRYDVQARKYMAKVFKYEQPTGITLPHSRWHPDGTLIKLYICLQQPDCNLYGTTFFTGYVKELFPVMLRSTRRMLSARERALLRNRGISSFPVAAVNLFESDQGIEKGQLNFPRGIVVDSAGNIFVSDSNNHRLQKFSPTGTFLNVIGKRGQGPGEFYEPGGIALDSGGNIYVCDVANRRVQKLNPDGTFLAEWKGPEPGFYGPRDLFVGPDNSVYVIDQGHSRIVRFDSNGKVVAIWGTPGAGDGQFKEPTAVVVDGKNERVYVADPRNKRIEVFDPNGRFIEKWLVNEWGTPAAWYFQDLAIDSINELLYASSPATNDVLVFDLSGNKVKSVKADFPDQVDGASAIALLKNNLYVVNTFSARVRRLDLETTR